MGEITYNEALMAEIAAKYSEAETKASDILAKLGNLNKCIAEDYSGGADVQLEELLGKTAGHVGILKDCCSNTGAYVTRSCSDMMAQDAALMSKGVGNAEK